MHAHAHTHTHTPATVRSLDVTGRCRGLRAQVCAACAYYCALPAILVDVFCHTLMGLLPSANVPRASCPVLRTDCSKLRLPARPVVRQQRKSGRGLRSGPNGCVRFPPWSFGRRPCACRGCVKRKVMSITCIICFWRVRFLACLWVRFWVCSLGLASLRCGPGDTGDAGDAGGVAGSCLPYGVLLQP